MLLFRSLTNMGREVSSLRDPADFSSQATNEIAIDHIFGAHLETSYEWTQTICRLSRAVLRHLKLTLLRYLEMVSIMKIFYHTWRALTYFPKYLIKILWFVP